MMKKNEGIVVKHDFEKAKKESLGLGHLKYEEKDRALRQYYGYKQ